MLTSYKYKIICIVGLIKEGDMGEIVRSKLTDKEYDIKNIVRIINIY